MTVVTGDSKFAVTKWIVSPNISDGATHTTITAALTDASPGEDIFIKPGVYTENITLKAGVNLVAFSADSQTPNVTIKGKCSFSATGHTSISGIRLKTNGDFFLSVTGANACIVNLTNCYLEKGNNTGIEFTNSNASSDINIFFCNGDVGSIGVALHTMTSPGSLSYINCGITNSGASTTVSNNSAGSVFFINTSIESALSNSGISSLIGCLNSNIDCTGINTTAITNNSTGGGLNASQSGFAGGTSPCLVLGPGSNALVSDASVSSSNVNALTGSGTIRAPSLSFTGISNGNNLTGIVPQLFGFLNTWTPGLAFGGNATGITYSEQVGSYILIGRLIFCTFSFTLTSKGAQVGVATLTGLPFTSETLSQGAGSGSCYITNVTLSAGNTYLIVTVSSNDKTCTFSQSGTGIVASGLTDTNFANNSQVTGSFMYITA